MARFDLTPLEADRMTQYEFHMYLLAYRIKMQEKAFFSAQQAWFNQQVKATKKVGKEIRSVYKTFDDFYNNTKEYNRIFMASEKQNARKLTIADMNRRINSKGG